MAVPVARRNLLAETTRFAISVDGIAFAVIKVRHLRTDMVELIVAEKAVIA
jgi:hypothetical protein